MRLTSPSFSPLVLRFLELSFQALETPGWPKKGSSQRSKYLWSKWESFHIILYCEKMAVSYSNQHVLTISCVPVLDNDKSRVILYASISGAVVFIVCCSLLVCMIYRWRLEQRKGKNRQQLLKNLTGFLVQLVFDSRHHWLAWVHYFSSSLIRRLFSTCRLDILTQKTFYEIASLLMFNKL